MNLPNYKVPDLGYLSLAIGHAHYQLHRDELTQMIVGSGEGKIADSGAPVIETGKFTGRSPKDRFIVKDKITGDRVFWSDVNIAMSEKHFDRLYGSMMHYMAVADK